MLVRFEDWIKEREATSVMEKQIIADKLAEGINGIEWLVMQLLVNEKLMVFLNNWLEVVSDRYQTVEEIMKDALTMGHEEFYKLHELNWWISVRDSLTYLNLLRQRNYDEYFDFLQNMEKKGEIE
ncbi:hypothetical protein [Paenibacillus sp. FSL K6-2524]|uniref:hypothetical protein n=1 Tax=Paenibacillus sp. FSL K6-2524 TaxID=2954516 RepID=UPI0030FB6BE3